MHWWRGARQEDNRADDLAPLEFLTQAASLSLSPGSVVLPICGEVATSSGDRSRDEQRCRAVRAGIDGDGAGPVRDPRELPRPTYERVDAHRRSRRIVGDATSARDVGGDRASVGRRYHVLAVLELASFSSESRGAGD